MSAYQQVYAEPPSLDNEENDWQNVGSSFADFAKLAKLNNTSKQLKELGLLVKRQAPFPELNRLLAIIRRAYPELLDTTLVILSNPPNRRQPLTRLEVNNILKDILEARKQVARSTVEEGTKCNITVAWAQYSNLYRAWREISTTKNFTRNWKGEIPEIERMLQRTKEHCIALQKLIVAYKPGDSLAEIYGSYCVIREGYKQCYEKIGDLTFQVEDQLWTLKCGKLDAQQATAENTLRTKASAIKTIILSNPLLSLANMATYGPAAAGYLITSKRADKFEGKIRNLIDKLAQLTSLLREIEDIKNEAELLLKGRY